MGLMIFLFRVTTKYEECDHPIWSRKIETTEIVGDFITPNCLMNWAEKNLESLKNVNCLEIKNNSNFVIKRKELVKLLRDIEAILCDNNLATILMPTRLDYPAGVKRYNKQYFKELEYIKLKVKRLLRKTNFKKDIINFSPWWDYQRQSNKARGERTLQLREWGVNDYLDLFYEND